MSFLLRHFDFKDKISFKLLSTRVFKSMKTRVDHVDEQNKRNGSDIVSSS